MADDHQTTENPDGETGDEIYAQGRSDMMVEVLLRAKTAARYAGAGDSPEAALQRVMDALNDLAGEEDAEDDA